MKKLTNNKELTSNELNLYESSYQVTVVGNKLCVRSKMRDVSTLKPLDKPLIISPRNFRKITISVESIEMWKNHFYNMYSLFRVHNAITKLAILYIPCTYENVCQCIKEH